MAIMSSQFFFIFPERSSSANKTCDIFEDDSIDEQTIEKNLDDISRVCKIFKYEKIEYYYDRHNVIACFFPNGLPKKRDKLFNKRTLILEKLRRAKNWRANRVSNAKDEYSISEIPISDNSLCEVAERKIIQSSANSTFLLLLTDRNILDIYGNNINCNKGSQTLDYLECLDFKGMHEWLSENRRPVRTYHKNPKHGECGKGNQKGESILLGSEQEARELLKFAIGMSFQGKLFYYDEKYKHYMEYKHEVNNLYHSFHITSGQEKDRMNTVEKKLVDYFANLSGNLPY